MGTQHSYNGNAAQLQWERSTLTMGT